MQIEYGKIAYVKVLELEKQLKEITNLLKEKQNEDSNVYLISENDNNNSNFFEKTFVFNSINSGKYKVSGITVFSTDIESEIKVKYYLNGENVYTHVIGNSEDINYNFYIMLASGKNQIKVEISSTNNFNLINLSLNIERDSTLLGSGKMSSTIVNDKEYILFVSDNLGKVYEVDNQTIVPLLVYTFNCSSGVILCSDSEKITIICSSLEGKLNQVDLFVSDFSSVTTDLGYGGVSSVAGIKYGDGYKVLFTRFGELFEAIYNSSGTFKAEKTGKKGSQVYGEPSVSGIYIVVDSTKKTKIILE